MSNVREQIINNMEADDLVNTLEISIEELVDILWPEVLAKQDKFYFLMDRVDDIE